MREYFALQYNMTNRKFKDAGFEPLLAYLILMFGFIGISIYLFYKTEFAEYIFLLSALTLVSKLSEKRRNEFLKICFGDIKLIKIRITENLLYSLPFLIFLFYKQLFLSSLLLFVLSIILALINFKTNINYIIWTPFAKRPFEFTIGFRKSIYILFASYILTVIAIYVNNFNLGAFAMLIVFATTMSYFTSTENVYYVWIYNTNAKGFLYSKIKTALLFSTLLTLPIALFIGIFNYQNVGILSIFYVIGWAFLITIILSKYSIYPNEMNIIQSIIIALCIWFPPLLIIIIPLLFKKSKKRLSNLLK